MTIQSFRAFFQNVAAVAQGVANTRVRFLPDDDENQGDRPQIEPLNPAVSEETAPAAIAQETAANSGLSGEILVSGDETVASQEREEPIRDASPQHESVRPDLSSENSNEEIITAQRHLALTLSSPKLLLQEEMPAVQSTEQALSQDTLVADQIQLHIQREEKHEEKKEELLVAQEQAAEEIKSPSSRVISEEKIDEEEALQRQTMLFEEDDGLRKEEGSASGNFDLPINFEPKEQSGDEVLNPRFQKLAASPLSAADAPSPESSLQAHLQEEPKTEKIKPTSIERKIERFRLQQQKKKQERQERSIRSAVDKSFVEHEKRLEKELAAKKKSQVANKKPESAASSAQKKNIKK